VARRRLGKAGWNERLKLLATSLNAVGLAFLGLGALGPLLSGLDRPAVQYALCGVISVALHVIAQWVLRWLED
jgi:hypothetical protein